jgi:DnaD/phage-associated family protein
MCTLNNNNTMNDDGDIYKRTPETEDIQEKIQELVKKYFGRNSTDKDLEIVRSLVYRKQSIDQKTTVGPDDTKVELLEHAMDIAYMSGTMTWNYVLGILRNFTKRGITTVDDAEAYQAEIDMAAGKI